MNKPVKNIAFIINVFREDDFHSGGEKLFYELVNKAINENFKVDLYCCKYLHSSPEPVLNLNKLVRYGNSRDFKKPEKIEAIFNEFKKHIANESYDLVISENITPPVQIAIMQGHSAIHYAQNAGNIFEQALMTIKKKEFIKYQKKWFEKGYKKIIVPSQTLMDELINNFNVDKNRFIVSYPGVEVPSNVLEIEIEAIVSTKRPITIGLSAPSFKNKGGYIFLEALKLLKQQSVEFKAKIIYPKYDKNLYLKTLVKLYGLENSIEFVGHQTNMSDFYNSVDIVVVPSLLETFGLVILEAMAHKRIPIVSNLAGGYEIIDEGQNGFVLDMKNNPSKNLAILLKNIIKNPESLKQISKNASATAKNFSWDRCSDHIFKALL